MPPKKDAAAIKREPSCLLEKRGFASKEVHFTQINPDIYIILKKYLLDKGYILELGDKITAENIETNNIPFFIKLNKSQTFANLKAELGNLFKQTSTAKKFNEEEATLPPAGSLRILSHELTRKAYKKTQQKQPASHGSLTAAGKFKPPIEARSSLGRDSKAPPPNLFTHHSGHF